MSEDVKKEHNTKKVVVDKDGKTREVDVYDREGKKSKDPEKLKAIFSSNLE